MTTATQKLDTLEQRFLEKQAALFRDVLEGNELNPSNYVLALTPEEIEAYLDEYSSQPGPEGAGLSPSGLDRASSPE
jgi:hypothetical protein